MTHLDSKRAFGWLARLALLPLALFAVGCLAPGAGREAYAANEAPESGNWSGGYASGPAGYERGGEGEGQAAGVPYTEVVLGGARPEDRLPMIVALHPRGGRPGQFEHIFESFQTPARLIIPHGGGTGRGGYSWFNASAVKDDMSTYAEGVRPVVERVAMAVRELVARRPTSGKPIVCGFSQGAALSFSLATLHPEIVSNAFPMSSILPVGFAPAAWPNEVPRPRVHAFIGGRDSPVRVEQTRRSIAELKALGFDAQLTMFPDLGHELRSDELAIVLAEIDAAARRPGGP